MKFTFETANAIYDILVKHAGASADEHDRRSFVFPHTTRETYEYRFCGKLGGGGKFWSSRMTVSCYPEHMTPERKAIIKKVNELLQELT